MKLTYREDTSNVKRSPQLLMGQVNYGVGLNTGLKRTFYIRSCGFCIGSIPCFKKSGSTANVQ